MLISSSILAPALAQDSVARGSADSVGASALAGLSAAWVAYAGSEFTVQAIRASANGVELVLKGVGNAVETSAFITREILVAAGVAVGTTVRVVAETTGYALIAAGRMIAFVPNETSRGLLQRTRH